MYLIPILNKRKKTYC